MSLDSDITEMNAENAAILAKLGFIYVDAAGTVRIQTGGVERGSVSPTGVATGVFNGGSSSAILKTVTQTAHGFTAGQAVRWNGTTYVLSEADVAADSDIDGFVAASIDANTFSLQSDGYGDFFTGLTPGSDYFESATVPGGITATEPSTAGQVSKPLLHAVTTTGGWIQNMRGLVIPAPATLTFSKQFLSESVAVTVAENLGKFAPPGSVTGWTLTGVELVFSVAPTGSRPAIAVRKGAATELLTTNITVDTGETSSATAATAPVINNDGRAVVAANDIYSIDGDAADSNSADRGATLYFTFTSP